MQIEEFMELISSALNIEIDSIHVHSALREDIGLDDDEIYELIVSLEDEIGTSIPQNDIDLRHCYTISDLFDLF